ncbi:MAG: D-arabinono-1,4-lactone oxidase [Trizodia sp. TS-e1964]|nr:MAG: D-arabinono-1,4-lactone oxidase [Trizodia sp. TS-e1964]
MDLLVVQELLKSDTSIPFRASTGYTHHTWARTFHSRPELYLRPQSHAEIQKIVNLARKCRRRLTTVGCGHSPSDLTCTSSWMVNLDDYSEVLSVDSSHHVVMQSGIRLHELGEQLHKYGLAMPNLGSIDNQSIAGAIATGTHGSTLEHGLLSEAVVALKIILANGRTILCSKDQNEEVFRAALISLGALGIITEITFKAVPSFNIEWTQRIQSLDSVLSSWEGNLWTQSEFVRVWWLPYSKRAVVWNAEKTAKPELPAVKSWYDGKVGYHTYHILLYIGQWIPRFLPTVEWFVFGMQYGFKSGKTTSAVQASREGLLMNCLYSQFVNEWALPLSKGPEAISRLSAWLHGDKANLSCIPFSSKGLYVHCPIEVRVSDTSSSSVRPYLDPTCPDEPTLYLNATLYRPYNQDPPCRKRYYEAFEWLMKDMGGRPHWAKNFATVHKSEIWRMYGSNIESWLKIRDEVDPEGMFVGDWHHRNLLPDNATLPLSEKLVKKEKAFGGGWLVRGILEEKTHLELSRPSSRAESFDLMHGAEAEASVFLPLDNDTYET